ncbi:MAG: hypothetical protein CTY10_08625 [Methylotenera sp.]|nr:MAG: hypothetical protein CTY10_08625 [Methylotenera sp.]
MARILLLIVLVWLLYVVIKRAFLTPNSDNTSQQNQKVEEKVVQCAACGTHVPESESVLIESKIICNNPDCRQSLN